MDKSKVIFGNAMSRGTYKKAVRGKKGYVRKFGDDSKVDYELTIRENKHIGDILGVKDIVVARYKDNQSKAVNSAAGDTTGRNSVDTASAAHSMGYTPYWMDLNSFPDTICTKVISAQNDLYSLGSRISQKSRLFNKLVWEPMNYEGFRKLSYNACDQKNAELMAPVYRKIPKDIPVVGTHVWPAQAAVHAGMEHVVNAIPDNWPMALHLSEGSIHTIQTHNSYMGYRILNGMDGKKVLKPMPEGSLIYTGHYIDHELVSNIENDCDARTARKKNGTFIIAENG